MARKEGIRVLLLVADETVGRSLCAKLERLGHNAFLMPHSSDDAFARLKSESHDLLLVDLDGKNSDGLGFVERLMCQHPLPVVGLLEEVTSSWRKQAQQLGIGACLAKTHTAADLNEALLIARARHDDLLRLRELCETRQRERRHLALVMDHVPILLAHLTSGERFLLANRAYAEFFGGTPDGLREKTLAEVLPPAVYAEDRPFIARVLQGETVSYEREIAGRAFRVTCTPDHAPIGSVIAFFVTLTDITEGQTVQRALSASQHRFHELLETVQMAAVILDGEARISYCNEYFADLVQRPKATILGSDWVKEFVPEVDQAARRLLFASFWASGQYPTPRENLLKVAQGPPRLMQWDNAVLRDENGALVGLAALGRDITAQRELEEQFMQAQKMESVGRLAGGIAHDFNNLLTGIQGNLSLALSDVPAQSALYDILNEVNKAAESAAGLTRQLLAFSRKQVSEPRVVDINDVIRDLLKMLERLIGADVDIQTDLCAEVALGRIDPGQLQQVLVNLAVNARDAMPRGGRLTIRTTRLLIGTESGQAQYGLQPGPYLCLSFCDEGCGMSAEVRSHLFEPFYTTKARGKGTGLGLSTVYGIVKQNHAEIEVHSVEQVGTTFNIYLPEETTNHAPLTVPKKSLLSDRLPGGNETLWIVEDEAVVRELASKILARLGYTVRAFDHGEAVLEALEAHQGALDLILTDLVMPQMSGRALAREVASRRPAVKILYTSGYSGFFDDAEDELETDEPHFIAKPYTPQSLSRKLREVLEN